jgi:cell wall-associated NlpC family hydrolase
MAIEDETRLLERLLEDPDFRAAFRADPVGAAREAGLPGLSEQLARTEDPMQTLEFRESRSSVAGALMAAAVEGLGILEGVGLFGADEAYASPGPSGHDWDPSAFGRAGSGGAPTTETLELLRNPNVVFDASGLADLRAGRIDPRLVEVLDRISERHRISVSAMSSDHAQMTAGGSVSNHFYGRAFDIATVDGRPVNTSNDAARRLAVELSSFDPNIRPSEIGSPWSLAGPAYFTDGDHQDHIHVGFDDPIDPSWKPSARAVVAQVAATPPQPSTDPDDLEGNLDDEDAGQDEADGSNEDEPDESGGEDDDSDSVGGPADQGGEDEEDADADDGDEDEDEDEDEEDEEDEDEPDEGEDDEGNGELPDADDVQQEEPGDSSDSDDDSSDAGSSDEPTASDAAAGDADDAADAAYPGDDAPRAQVAQWMANAAEARGLPRELPVMTGLVESGLRNLDYGDADSVGFFQMRESIWNKGEYAGYPRDPELRLKWFLDHAAAEMRQRKAQGLPVDDPRQYGEWIADVQRPAVQYRARYQAQLDNARELLGRSERRALSSSALPDALDGDVDTVAGAHALAALAEAKKYVGTPYKWGGSSPNSGFDCSGLVQWAYAKVGIRIPRVTDQQFEAPNGIAVDRKHLLPGDLVFFRDSSGYVHHVGISLGGDTFLHSPHTGDVVKTSSLDDAYYAREFAGGRRFDRARVEEVRAEASSAPEAPRAPVAAPEPDPVDAQAVRIAQAALDEDAAEVNQMNTALFRALERQEEGKGNAVQFFPAIKPS